MGPDKNQRNDPTTVPRGVAAIARARKVDELAMKEQIQKNYESLFGIPDLA